MHHLVSPILLQAASPHGGEEDSKCEQRRWKGWIQEGPAYGKDAAWKFGNVCSFFENVLPEAAEK